MGYNNIILFKCSLIESRQCNGKRKKKKKQHEDAAQKGKNHENKTLTGPLKSLGAPGKYPLLLSVGLITSIYQKVVQRSTAVGLV